MLCINITDDIDSFGQLRDVEIKHPIILDTSKHKYNVL